MRGRILIVDDDPIVAESLAEHLAAEGFDTSTALNAGEAMAALDAAATETPEQRAKSFDIVLCDVSMPGVGGMDLLRDMGRKHRGTAVVMITGYGTIETAVEALRAGACDFLTKPIVDSELMQAVERALRQRAILAENMSLRRRLDGRHNLDNIAGSDPRMLKIYDLIEAVAPSRTTVLMTGESGTGKSLIAHAIHHRSPRKDKPFIEISSGSIPETLLESELFGHVKGAFTGAHADKVGRFLAADGGTIFLDEINSASPGLLLMLLGVLLLRMFVPVGSNKTVEVDARVILATNQPLERLVSEGQFRQDLYYRINVVKIELPPLRERIGDIPALAARLLKKHAAELGKQIVGFAPEAMEHLRRYAYPGNVRELMNIVERAAVLCRRPTITVEDLPPQVVSNDSPLAAMIPGAAGAGARSAAGGLDEAGAWDGGTLEAALRDPERRIIVAALKANEFNRQQTAEALGINRTTLYKKIKALGIQDDLESGRLAG